MGEILSPLFFFFLLVDLASGGDNGYWGGSGFLLHLQNQRLQRRHLVSTTPLHLVCVCVCVSATIKVLCDTVSSVCRWRHTANPNPNEKVKYNQHTKV